MHWLSSFGRRKSRERNANVANALAGLGRRRTAECRLLRVSRFLPQAFVWERLTFMMERDATDAAAAAAAATAGSLQPLHSRARRQTVSATEPSLSGRFGAGGTSKSSLPVKG